MSDPFEVGISKRAVLPLQDGCPWADWARPNVAWCESNQNCQWIVAPMNTWTNLAYIFAGYHMLRAASQQKSKILRQYGLVMIALGFLSGAFHATYTQAGQWLDYVGMYLVIFMPVSINARRSGQLSKKAEASAYQFLVVLASLVTFLFYYFVIPVQLIVAFIVVVILVQEARLRCRYADVLAHKRPNYTAFLLGLLFVLIAATFSALDATGTWCDPNAIVTGHPLWHLFSAAGLWFLFKFYAQFALEPGMKAESVRGKLLPLVVPGNAKK